MFGSLRPSLCHLPPDQGAAYRRMYCGTCQSLGEHYGHLTRPLLSFDVVLLSSIVEALQEQPGAADSCRCPLLPVVHRPTLAPTGSSMRLAAAVQVVLAEQWLADHAQDGSALGKLGRPLLRKRADKARSDLEELGLDLHALDELATRQLSIERTSRAFTDAAEPTAAVLESLFGQIGRLPGATTTATHMADDLAALGRRLGIAIYALDALEDLADDVAGRQFNPCIDSNARISTISLERVITALDSAVADIQALVAVIPWHRHQQIIASILTRRFPARCRKAIRSARDLASAQPAPRSWLARSPLVAPVRVPARMLLGLWSMAATLWAVFVRHVRVAVRRHEQATTCDVDDVQARTCPVTPSLVAAGDVVPPRVFAQVDGDDDDQRPVGYSGGESSLGSGGLVLDPSVVGASKPASGEPDLSQEPDLSHAPDLSQAPDLSPPPGQSPYPELSDPSDVSLSPDLSDSPDLSRSPDLSQPPRRRRRGRKKNKQQQREEIDGYDCCETLCCGIECCDCACCCLSTENACSGGEGCCAADCCDGATCCCDCG